MSIIAFMNQKGGVGKTTTAINLAAQSALKSKTLMVDCDKQGNLTSQFISEPNQTIKDIFLGKKLEPIKINNRLHLLPSSIAMAGVDLMINHEPGRESRLKKGLEEYEDYGFENIFIDCPPDISLITINALVAAKYCVLPIKAAKFSIEGLQVMLDFARKIRENYNPDLVLLGIVITQHDSRLKVINNKIKEELKDKGWDIYLFKTVIRRATDVEQGQFEMKNIFEYNKKSNAANDYANLGHEIANKIKKMEKKILID